MAKKIGIAVAVLVVLFLGIVASRPATFRVERSATFAAPPAVAFGLVNDFSKWAGWSPWEKLDASMKKTLSGPASGAGAKYEWVGNDKVGQGEMTILEAKAPERIAIDLRFLKPWAAQNPTTFDFKPAGEGVAVTWVMTGKNDFMGKLFGLFMDIDKMVGGDFERGLAAMKTLAEAESARLKAEAAAKAAAEAAAKAAAEAAAKAAEEAAAAEAAAKAKKGGKVKKK